MRFQLILLTLTGCSSAMKDASDSADTDSAATTACLPLGEPVDSQATDSSTWQVDRRPVFAVPLAVGARAGSNVDELGIYLDNFQWGYPPRWLANFDPNQVGEPTNESGDFDGDGYPDGPPMAVSQLIDQLLEKAYQVGFRRYMLWLPQGYLAYAKVGGGFHIDGYPPQLWSPLAADSIDYERPVGLTDQDIADNPGQGWEHLSHGPLAIPKPYIEDDQCESTEELSCRQQEWVRELGGWIQAKAAAGDPVDVGIYGGYHLHDPSYSDDPEDFAKPRLNYQFRYLGMPDGVKPELGVGNSDDDFVANWTEPRPWENPDHDSFYAEELCPWVEQVGFTLYGMDASRGYRWDKPETGEPLREYFHQGFPGLHVIGEAPPMDWDPETGEVGAFVPFEGSAYRFAPYIGLVDHYWMSESPDSHESRDYQGSVNWDRGESEIWALFNPSGASWSIYPLPDDAHVSVSGDRGGGAAKDYIDRGFVFAMYPRTDHRQQGVDESYWLLAEELVSYAQVAEGLR